MMNNTGIIYLNSYIPETSILVDEYLEKINDQLLPSGFEDKMEYEMFLKQILKLDGVRVEMEKDSTAMISILIKGMFDRKIINPDEVDLVIVAQERIYDQKENLGQYLLHTFSMKNAYVLNISGNYCANIDVALNIANSLISGKLKNILIVSATKKGNFNERIFGTYGILGDAAGIVLLSNENVKAKLIDGVILSNGALHDITLENDNFKSHCDYSIACISELLKRNNLSNKNIEKVLVQNANPLLISQCVKVLGIDSEKVYKENISKYGHLDSVDFIINLKDLLGKQDNIDQENYIISYGFGFAGTYTASLIKL